MRRKMQKKRKFFIMTASIGERGILRRLGLLRRPSNRFIPMMRFACWIFCPGMFFPLITS